MSPDDRAIALSALAAGMQKDVEAIAEAGLAYARLGGGVCAIHGIQDQAGPGRSVVVLLNGPIPDDLVEALNHCVGGISHDLKTSGKLTFLGDFRSGD